MTEQDKTGGTVPEAAGRPQRDIRPPQASRMQECAIHHGRGPMLVLAGPGSGKTFVVTRRIRALIEEHHAEPSGILVITFTKAAALEMEERFHRLTQNRYPVRFGTFHAVFYHILQQSSAQRELRILTESHKYNYIRDILRRRNIVLPSPEAFAEQFFQELGRMKNSGTALSEYEPGGCDRTLFRQTAEAYERQKRAEGSLDFDDILDRCHRLLTEDPVVCRRWQERFSFLLVDEFQDINEIQYRIVRILSERHGNLFAVGDDDQSIYGFRGARPDIMKRLLQDFPDCRQLFLTDNYRCAAPIVEAAGRVIDCSQNRMAKSIRAAGPETGTAEVRIRSFPTRKEETDSLAEELRLMCASKREKSAAVIFRTNRDMACFARTLLQEEIPFSMKEKVKSILRHFITQELLACLRFASGEQDRALFYRFMNHPYRGIARDAVTESYVEIGRLAEKLNPGKDGGCAYRQVKKLEGDLERLRRLPPYAALQYVCRGMGYQADLQERLRQSKQEDDMRILGELLESARDMPDLAAWRTELEERERKLEELAGQNKCPKTGTGLFLLTLHGAKGLEYDTVYLPGLNEGTIPHGRSLAGENAGINPAEALDEECRLLYVGMTRAREKLRLSYLTGTKEKPEQMSRFLRPLL